VSEWRKSAVRKPSNRIYGCLDCYTSSSRYFVLPKMRLKRTDDGRFPRSVPRAASRRNVRQHERRSEPFTYAKTALFGRQTFAVLLGIPLNQEFTWAALRAHACDPTNDKLPKRILVRGLSNRSVALPEEAMMFRSVIEEIEQVRPDVQRERTHMNQARNSLPPHCT